MTVMTEEDVIVEVDVDLGHLTPEITIGRYLLRYIKLKLAFSKS